MLSAGEIIIQMQPQASHFKATVKSTRPEMVSKLFTGKPVAYMLNTVPLLFNVCRAAQSVASVRAVEQALGIMTPIVIERYREQLVRFEMLHEHLWKLLIDLPAQLGLPPLQQSMVSVSQQLQPLLRQMQSISCCLSTQLNTWKETQPVLDTKLRNTLQTLLFGKEIYLNQYSDVLQSDGVAGQLLRSLQMIDFVGSPAWSRQMPLDKQCLYQTLTGASFAIESDYFSGETSPVDNGPLARMKSHSWLKNNINTALAPRLLSILAETEALLKSRGCAFSKTENHIENFGVSEVESARGRLQHVLLIDDKKTAKPVLTKMRVIAPTDWHFHTAGIAARSLALIPHEPELAYQRAELMIKLINPCVGYKITVHQKQEASSYA